MLSLKRKGIKTLNCSLDRLKLLVLTKLEIYYVKVAFNICRHKAYATSIPEGFQEHWLQPHWPSLIPCCDQEFGPPYILPNNNSSEFIIFSMHIRHISKFCLLLLQYRRFECKFMTRVYKILGISASDKEIVSQFFLMYLKLN